MSATLNCDMKTILTLKKKIIIHFTFKIRTNNVTNKNKPATHMFLDLKKMKQSKDFIYHLVLQNLRLQMNHTDFKLLYFVFMSKNP